MEKLGKTKDGLFSRQSLMQYSKTLGGISYTGLGLTITQPGLIRTSPAYYTNLFLTGSLVGGALYLYDRPHLQQLKTKKRVWLSIYGSGLFNFGSLLLWAIFNSATRGYNLHPIFRGFVSLAASYYMIRTALDWFQLIDKE